MFPSKAKALPQSVSVIKLEDSLKIISENILSIARSKDEFKIKLAKLKVKKLETLALVARSQALLATMDVLIADNELENDLKKISSTKRKRKSSNDGDSSAKKVKITEGSTTGKAKTSTTDKSPRQNNKNVTEPSKEKKSKVDSFSDEKDTTVLTNKKVNKENINRTPRYNKQAIILSRPPIRNDAINQNGYLTDGNYRHSKIENSIYNQIENTEKFVKTMTLLTNDSIKQRFMAVNQNGCYEKTCNQTDCNQNQMTCNQNNFIIPSYDQHQRTFNCNQIDYNANIQSYDQNRQSLQYHPGTFGKSLENTEFGENPYEYFKTTNEIYKDIMDRKSGYTNNNNQIKTEKQCASESSEKTLVIDTLPLENSD